METYTVYGPYGNVERRRGKIVQNDHDLFYFAGDWNKAKVTDSVSRYRLDDFDQNILHFVDYRRKKYIDDHVRISDATK